MGTNGDWSSGRRRLIHDQSIGEVGAVAAVLAGARSVHRRSMRASCTEESGWQALGRPSVELERVTKRFGDVTAVAIPRPDRRRRESSSRCSAPAAAARRRRCGWSPASRSPTEGRVLIDGVDVAGLPPFKRPTNTVFQSYALFPHLSVEDNVAFGLRRRGVAKEEVRRRVREELERVGPRRRGRSASHASSPAASSSASRWHGRSSTGRRCCCSTSRSARST